MIKRALLTLLISSGFLFTTMSLADKAAYDSVENAVNNTDFKPTPKERQTVDQFLRGYMPQMYDSLYYGACDGLYLCDCIHTRQGQQVIGDGSYYQHAQMICNYTDRSGSNSDSYD